MEPESPVKIQPMTTTCVNYKGDTLYSIRRDQPFFCAVLRLKNCNKTLQLQWNEILQSDNRRNGTL